MPCTYDPSPADYAAASKQSAERFQEKALYDSQATVLLCEACAEMEKYDMMRHRSPELQAFWKRHTEEDRAKLEKQLKEATDAADRASLLASLTPRDKELLGIK